MVVQDRELSVLRIMLWYLSDCFLMCIRKADLDLDCTYACSFPSSYSPTNSVRKK